MSWQRALGETAYVMAEAHACRLAGFTTEALHHPRTREELVAICAFNGVDPDKAPRGWHYAPNAGTKKAWARVVEALA